MEEEKAIKVIVSKHDEQEPETYTLRRGRVCRDDNQQTQQAGTRDLPTTKKKRPSRQWSANATSRNERLTNYEEKQAIDMMISKRDEQGPETYELRRGRGH